MASIPRPTRTIPSTPKRPTSAIDLTTRLTRTGSATPSLLSTHKKYKAPLSAESRTRHAVSVPRPKSALATVPGTPTKERPKTPGGSEMDVSNVDPEEVLVDYQTVEAGDVSGDLDEAWLRSAQIEHGKQDKVMVSVRVRPSGQPSAWQSSSNTIKLSNNNHPQPQEFNFDSVLTGSQNKPIYSTVARSHVQAAMEGYNAVVFAYGQTASGKTYTLSGDVEEPGIIPRAMRDVFAIIRRTPTREYLLRCSYLEIYNETINDLLAPPSSASAVPVQIQGTPSGDVILTPLREEVVTGLKSVKEVLRRGEGNRRTACTDWNDRSSRSHSVFRLVIESRERGTDASSEDADDLSSSSPASKGRQTPGPSGRQTPGQGGPRLQARGGRSVQTSVLSLIDLAGSEKATSDKERTREGKYINTSLLTLGTVIGTLADNASRGKNDHVPYRNSKLTRMLQPSLAGNARVSVICTINPDAGAVAESTSTLLFARRIKGVKLNAQKHELVDTDALIERYRKEIEDLKRRLAEREADAPVRTRRLSAREQVDESKAMKDLNTRIQQLTKLILTSQSVDEAKGDESRPASPVKIDFDMTPYQLQQELLSARLQIESQATQILSLEASLLSRPPLPPTAPEAEKDALIARQAQTIRELEIAVRGYEDNLGEPLRAVREDVEREWVEKVEAERRKREEGERWVLEVGKELEKEKKMRHKLEDERRALAAFVSKFDALGLGLSAPAPPAMPSPGGAARAFQQRREEQEQKQIKQLKLQEAQTESSPLRMGGSVAAQPLLLEQMPEEGEWGDVSFEAEAAEVEAAIALEEVEAEAEATPKADPEPEPERTKLNTSTNAGGKQGGRMMMMFPPVKTNGLGKAPGGMKVASPVREVFGDKENIPLVR
ncbi:P-loop containing nucleoside triphosphate hydrolase protein [Infundibulicybe gibba]|nr:P-loop containing nucleoside triphosphate hydrolase protein [Infundibulicybe gibba]